MPAKTLKGAWQVRAGVIPQVAMEEHGRTWPYTSEMFSEDLALPDAPDAAERSHFQRLRREAADYAESLTDPRRLNWVELTWIWY